MIVALGRSRMMTACRAASAAALAARGCLVDLDVKATVEASVGDDAVEAQLGRRLQTRLALKVTKASEIDGRAPRHVGPSSV